MGLLPEIHPNHKELAGLVVAIHLPAMGGPVLRQKVTSEAQTDYLELCLVPPITAKHLRRLHFAD